MERGAREHPNVQKKNMNFGIYSPFAGTPRRRHPARFRKTRRIHRLFWYALLFDSSGDRVGKVNGQTSVDSMAQDVRVSVGSSLFRFRACDLL